MCSAKFLLCHLIAVQCLKVLMTALTAYQSATVPSATEHVLDEIYICIGTRVSCFGVSMDDMGAFLQTAQIGYWPGAFLHFLAVQERYIHLQKN